MSGWATYAWLDQFRARMGLASTDHGDDTRLLEKLRAATAYINRFTGRDFNPVQAAYAFDWQSYDYLQLKNRDLLQLTSIMNGDGIPLDPSHVIKRGRDVYYELIPRAGYGFLYDTTHYDAITVTGVWGYHPEYADAFRLADNFIGDLTEGVNGLWELTVEAADDVDSRWYAPRLQVGQLWRVATEYWTCQHIEDDHVTVTVRREQNGSLPLPAIEELTPIEVWWPLADIQEACLQVASWLVRREDGGEGGRVGLPAAAGFSVPNDFPPAALEIMMNYKRGD